MVEGPRDQAGIQASLDRAEPSLSGRQRSHRGATPVELAGNLQSWKSTFLGAGEEGACWRGLALKLPQRVSGAAVGIWVQLAAAVCCRSMALWKPSVGWEPGSGEPERGPARRHVEENLPLETPADKAYHCAAGERKCLKGPDPFSQCRQTRVTLELRP